MPQSQPAMGSRRILRRGGLVLVAAMMVLCWSRAALAQSTSCRFYDDTTNRAPISVTGDTSNCQSCRSACQLSPQCGFYSWGGSAVTLKADSSPCFVPYAQTVATAGATIADCATVPGYSVVNGWSHDGDNIFCTSASSDSQASIAQARARDCNSNPACLSFSTYPSDRSGLTASCVKTFANITRRFTNPFDSRLVGVGSGMCFYVRDGSVSVGRINLGCYGASNLGSVTTVLLSTSNLGQCEQVARRHGFAYFAVGAGDVCYASQDLSAISRNGRTSGCSVRCLSNSSYTGDLSDDICGGNNAVSLYALTYGNGDLRITPQLSVSGATLSGRLEVYSAARGTWGTVCDDGFDALATSVACAQLGLSGDGATYTSNSLRSSSPRSYPTLPIFTAERNSIFLDNVRCSGAETSLLQCATIPLASTNHNCNRAQDVELTCTLPSSGAVRLAGGGPSPGVLLGRVEVYNSASRTWGSVCDDVLVSRTGSDEAAAVCRSLGLSPVGAIFDSVPTGNAFGAPPPGGFFFDDFTCPSTASNLVQCVDLFPSRLNDCRNGEESAIICSTDAPIPTPSPVPVPSPNTNKPKEAVPLDCPIIPRYELTIGRERMGSDIPGGCFPSHAGDGPRPIRTTVEQAAVSCDGIPVCRAFNAIVGSDGFVRDSCMKLSASINSINASVCFYKRIADSCEHNRTLSNGTSSPLSIDAEVSNCQLCRAVCEANSQCTTWRWANSDPAAPTDSSPCYLPPSVVTAVPSTTTDTTCATVAGYSLVDGYDVSGNEISCETASSTSIPATDLALRSALACNRQPGCMSFNTYPGGSGGAQRSCLKSSANANSVYYNSNTNRAGVGSGMCLYVKEGALSTSRRLLGCYEDPNNNALFQTSRRVRGLAQCEQTARYRGTTFFALLNGTTCYVEDELATLTGRSRSTACRPCPENSAETCGASRAISIYSITHSNGALRLTGGSHNRGRLEIYSTARGSWGSICDRSFGTAQARVACRQLGFSDVGVSYTSRAQGSNDLQLLPALGGVFLDSIGCTGLEGNLLNCQIGSFPQRTSCPRDNEVELTCVEPGDAATRVQNGQVGGGTSTIGRLEIYSTERGAWGTVCDDNFNSAAATVACNELGFRRGSGEAVRRSDAFGAPPAGGVYMDDFDCSAFPQRLARCAAQFPSNSDCGHNEDVVLSCASQ